jgi:hypothetical protein
LFLDFLALHISPVLLLGFMIFKLHASSPLWCSSFDLLALHYFMLFFLLVSWSSRSYSIRCLQVCWEIRHPPKLSCRRLFSGFFTAFKELWPPPLLCFVGLHKSLTSSPHF